LQSHETQVNASWAASSNKKRLMNLIHSNAPKLQQAANHPECIETWHVNPRARLAQAPARSVISQNNFVRFRLFHRIFGRPKRVLLRPARDGTST
jgi:hypothetical protein